MFIRAFAMVIALALTGSPALAATAPPAQGVHVDPGSPAGKEYAIPLDSARGGSAGALFGSGISRPSGDASPARPTTGDHRAPTRGSGPGSRRTRPATPAGTATGAGIPEPAAKVLRSGSGTGIAWMAALAAAVLCLGGLVAFTAAARGRRGDPTPSP